MLDLYKAYFKVKFLSNEDIIFYFLFLIQSKLNNLIKTTKFFCEITKKKKRRKKNPFIMPEARGRSEDVSSPVRHALCKLLVFKFQLWQQQLKTVEKTDFWNWNNLVILRGKFTFNLTGQSFIVIGTPMSSWIWIRLTFLWWKYGV